MKKRTRDALAIGTTFIAGSFTAGAIGGIVYALAKNARCGTLISAIASVTASFVTGYKLGEVFVDVMPADTNWHVFEEIFDVDEEVTEEAEDITIEG